MKWTCQICQTEHASTPLCFEAGAPWRPFVAEGEVERRVQANADQCVIDGKVFLLRGHLEIPIHDYPAQLAYSVWVSLSQENAQHIAQRWDDPERVNDPPYYGWLSSALPGYPETLQLKAAVQSQPPGQVPSIVLEPGDHPLAREQHEGISIERWHELAHRYLQHA